MEFELITEKYFDEYKQSFSGAEDKKFVDENATKQDIETALNSCVSVFMEGMNNYL